MYRKLHVTPAEMLQLREQGLSNHDIAKSLDISINTVKRYIGKQGGRMERLVAFDDPKPTQRKTETEAVFPKYEPKPVLEQFRVGDDLIELNNTDRVVTISSDAGDIVFTYESIPDLVQFLAWAMRERMDVTE